MIWQFYIQFFKESPYSSPQWRYQFTFLPTVQEGSLFSTPSPAFIVCRFKFYLFIYLIYLFMAELGLRCCVWAFSSCGEQGLLFLAVRGFLIAVASRCGAQALSLWASVVVVRRLQSAGSVVVAHGLSCSAACVIFPGHGLNPSPLHWQADS